MGPLQWAVCFVPFGMVAACTAFRSWISCSLSSSRFRLLCLCFGRLEGIWRFVLLLFFQIPALGGWWGSGGSFCCWLECQLRLRSGHGHVSVFAGTAGLDRRGAVAALLPDDAQQPVVALQRWHAACPLPPAFSQLPFPV